MPLALELFTLVALLELSLRFQVVWRHRRPGAVILLVLLIASSGLVLNSGWHGWTVLVAFFSLYRVVNLLRVFNGRAQPEYLYQAAWQSSLWLIACQLVILAVVGLNHSLKMQPDFWWYFLAIGQLAGAIVLAASLRQQLQRSRPPQTLVTLTDRDLPALTVAIPARNETEDLVACLDSLVASTYPKLEIIVLDDCSQNKHTPEIIRSFAHQGVRFIAGAEPPKRWLAKNYAYSQLAAAASGEVLLFCGVDARFEPDTLTAMIKLLIGSNKTMASFMPRNTLPAVADLDGMFVQPGRYAWELAVPREELGHPPVLSTCWLINAKSLQQAGGFEAVAHSISPEAYFARQAAQVDNSYGFVQSDDSIGLLSAKSLAEQQATAIRTRYPQLHRRPELVGVTTLLEAGLLVLPFCVLISSLLVSRWLLVGLSAASYILLTAIYVTVVATTYRRLLLRALWLFPLAALYDIGLLNHSMIQYEFSQVLWKGRNICIPLMQAIPSLPKK